MSKGKSYKETYGYVCIDCGDAYLIREGKRRSGTLITTMHEGECCVCDKVKGVLSTRHFNYLRKTKL